MRKCVLFVLLAMSMTGTAVAQFGALDVTFNPSGISTSGDVYNVATQPDGKVLVGGLFANYQGVPKNNFVRLNQDGSLDNSFATQFDNTIRQIIVLADGKILVAGAFTSCSTSSGSVTVRGIARLNADGTFDNTFNAGGFGISQPVNAPDNPMVISMGVLSDGKIVIAGDFKSYNGTTVNCIARLNANGTLDNTFNIGTGANAPLDAIAVQADDKIVVGGRFTLFNGASIGYIARLNTDGSVDNTFNNGGSGLNGGYITVYKMEVQPDGKIIVGGSFSSYNGNPFNNFMRLNTDGSIDNTFNQGSGPSDQVFDIIVLSDNRILVCGLMSSYNGTNIGRIACLQSDGSLDNTFNSGGTGANDLVFSIALTTDNKIILGGVFGSYNGTNMQRVARLNLVACTPATGTDVQTACGSYTWIDGMNYTESNTTATDTIVGGAANGCDSIVTLNLTINHPATGTDVHIACGSYSWIDGVNYTTSNNTATHTIIGGAANGCDSIVTLNLTINQPATGTDVHTACGSYSWIDGVNYTTSNNTATYTIVGGAANGCDSIVTLNLTINQPATGTDVHTACGSYTWIDGVNYITSNTTATHTIIGGAANGCDSIVTLNLTINQPATGTDVHTACGSYAWIDGVNYITSNTTATHTIIGGAANGCDSIVTLNLTINQPAVGTDTQTACGSYTWIDGVNYTTSNNTATHTIIGGASNGCDSVVTLNLTIQTINTDVMIVEAAMQAQLIGASYQWINCGANTPIPGATGREYLATVNGNYAVIVTLNGCSDTSACIQVANAGVEEIAGWNTVLYPNPSNGEFTIDWGTEVDNMSIEITDVTGKPVYRSIVSGTVSHIVDLKTATGLYYVTLSNGTQRRLMKVVID